MKNLHSIRWRLPLSYAAIALLAALVLGSVMLLVLNGFYTDMEREYLLSNAIAIRSAVEQVMRANLPAQALQDQAKGLSFLSQVQIRVLDTSGRVLADSGIPDNNQVIAVSAAPAGVMFNVAESVPYKGDGPTVIYRREGAAADEIPLSMVVPLEGNIQTVRVDTLIPVSASPFGYEFATERIASLNRRSAQVVSIPLSGPLGSLEISNGPAYGSDILRSVAFAWAIAGVLSIALAAWAGWYASKQVTQPVLALTQATRRMEQGQLAVRVKLPGEKQQEFLALAKSFNGMAQRVEDTVSTLRAFVSDAAHEINSPLTALKTNLELALTEPDSAQKELFLSRALEQNRRLEQLTSNLLDLSRIESTDSTFEKIDLRQLTLECGERFASRADQAERNFEMHLPENGIMIRGNPQQLQRAIDNLLENALKFTPPQGSISLKLEQDANNAVLTVTDTGIGIPPEDLHHLFERFHRGRNSAEYPGNGLGLAIVKAVADAHGGHVKALSQGEGSSFKVLLPRT